MSRGTTYGWLAVAATVASMAGIASSEELPKGYRQILPRGRIASIDAPRFVPAAKARIPGEAWVLGIVIDGETRAYSLNLLNRHEIVNDRVGERVFAAVW
jgi:hypothetical protein